MSGFARLSVPVLLGCATLLWMLAALQGWWIEQSRRQAEQIDPANEFTTLFAEDIPRGGSEAARAWARRLSLLDAGRDEEIAALYDASARFRPLHAPTWLDYADWLKSRGEVEQAARLTDQGRALWPGRPRLLWRAALLQLELGDFERAFEALRDYWAVEPGDGVRALGLMRRLRPEPETLANVARTAWESGVTEPLVYQRQVLALASGTGDQTLAAALWARLDDTARADENLLFPYLRLLIEGHHYDTLDRVWEQVTGAPPGLYNGDFERPLMNGGLGWRYRSEGEGFRVDRRQERAFGDSHAIRIEFAGTHNVNFHHLSQLMRVRPGQPYRLSGYWAGHELTTRSGVFVELYTVDSEQRARVRLEPRWGTWTRERFELDIEVPDTAHLLAVRVRRRATDALDRLIGGTLWLDDLTLHSVQ